jgi:hypothetical protein
VIKNQNSRNHSFSSCALWQTQATLRPSESFKSDNQDAGGKLRIPLGMKPVLKKVAIWGKVGVCEHSLWETFIPTGAQITLPLH